MANRQPDRMPHQTSICASVSCYQSLYMADCGTCTLTRQLLNYFLPCVSLPYIYYTNEHRRVKVVRPEKFCSIRIKTSSQTTWEEIRRKHKDIHLNSDNLNVDTVNPQLSLKTQAILLSQHVTYHTLHPQPIELTDPM